ncbi:hypothetical protein [Massilia sp. DWR3-1-1]|uniref:hypothetical protein n=1 Tax=Massilia sp. DWR3-1-1 TaxID=2804559 RepID=UPI003CEFFFDF
MFGQSPFGSAPFGSYQASAAPITGTASWTEGSESIIAAGAVGIVIGAALGWTEGAETCSATGAVAAPASSSAAIGWTEGAEVIAIAVGSASAAIIIGNWTEGREAHSMAVLVQTFYARAPSGSGFTPQQPRSQARPANTQGSTR